MCAEEKKNRNTQTQQNVQIEDITNMQCNFRELRAVTIEHFFSFSNYVNNDRWLSTLRVCSFNFSSVSKRMIVIVWYLFSAHLFVLISLIVTVCFNACQYSFGLSISSNRSFPYRRTTSHSVKLSKQKSITISHRYNWNPS